MPRYTTEDDSDPPLPTWNSSDEERERLGQSLTINARSKLHAKAFTHRTRPPSSYQPRIPRALIHKPAPRDTPSRSAELLHVITQNPARTETPSSDSTRLLRIISQNSTRPGTLSSHLPRNLPQNHARTRIPSTSAHMTRSSRTLPHHPTSTPPHTLTQISTCTEALSASLGPQSQSPVLNHDSADEGADTEDLMGSDVNVYQANKPSHLAQSTAPYTLTAKPARTEQPSSASAPSLPIHSSGAVDDNDSVNYMDDNNNEVDNDSDSNDADTEDFDVDDNDDSFHPDDDDSEDVDEDDDNDSSQSGNELQGGRIAGNDLDKRSRIRKNWRAFYARNREKQIARGTINYHKKMERLQNAGHDDIEAYRQKRRAVQEKYRKNNREKLALKQRQYRQDLKKEG